MRPSEFTALVAYILVTLTCMALAQDKTYSITEEEPEGSFVGNVARDINLAAFVTPEVFDQLQYNVLVGGDGALFRIDSANSDLFTNRKLDREIICRFEENCRLHFRIAARSESSIRTYDIAVNLLDVNDNAPVFNESVFVMSIPESVTAGTRYTIPGALDDDRGGTNSVQSYTLIQGKTVFDVEYFQKLDGTSDVNLIVKASLDRETQDFYSAMIVAKDGGDPQRSTSLQIDVHIEDVNDNSPSFPQTEYRVQIGENTERGAEIIELTAQDKDIGVNAEIQYRLSFHQDASVSEQFEIDRSDGKLKAKVALTSGRYSLIVEAVDQGTPQKVNQTVVMVLVIDTENNPPAITLDTLNTDSQTAYVSEGANVNTPVAHVTVIDPDSGQNGNVQCYSQSAFFDLVSLAGSKNYGVFLAKSLDRETIAQYIVTLFCEDTGSPKLNATKVFNVVVQDENDNPPIFEETDQTVSLAEGNSVNDVVLLISASDMDANENAKIYFTLIDDSDGYFNIPIGSNALLLDKVLDRETKDVHVVRILAKDGGEPSNAATATVTVSVTDINDVEPQFFQSRYSFTIDEGLPAGSFVGSVSAYDRDLGDGGRVSFSLVPGASSRGKFQMLDNGTLMTLTPLDREGVPDFTFPIQVADHGRPSLSSQVDVEIVVDDVNDNSPLFIFPSSSNQSLTLFLPVDSSKALVTLQVMDADEGENGDVTFFLHPGNSSRLFHVDEITGQLFAVRDMDGDDVETYNLSISATDKGEPALSTVHSLFIHVKVDPVMKPIQGEETNIVIALALVGGTLFLAAIVVLVVCLVKRRDSGSKLRYLDKKPSSQPAPPSVLDPSSLPNQYDKHFGFNNDNNNDNSSSNNNFNMAVVARSESTSSYKKRYTPKLSVGYPKAPSDHGSYQSQTTADGRVTLDPTGGRGREDEVDTSDKELNRVTSLRLQQAFQHISSIKSRLITPSDTTKPYEWREIHIPGEFGSLSSRSTTNNNNNVDSGVGTDDDAVFVHQRPLSSRTTRSPYRQKPQYHHYHHHHHPHHHHPGQQRRFYSQPPSDTSADSSHPSCSSLPNLCLKPGSDSFVFRPLSARSSESFPSETIDDQCTTTSGSYSINTEDAGHPGASMQLRTSPFIQDVYV